MADGGMTRRVFIVAVGRTASTASIFLVYAILARAWPGEQFGVFSAVWVLGNTLVPFFLLGLPTGLLYFFPLRNRQSRQTLVFQAALCLALSGVAAAVLLLSAGTRLASVFVGEGGAGPPGLTFEQYLIPFLPYVFSLVAGGYGESALVAAGRPTWQATLAFGTAIGVIGVAATGALTGASVPTVLWWLSAVGVTRMAISYLVVCRAVGVKNPLLPGVGVNCSASPVAELVRYSLPIAANDGVGSLSRSVDRLVVLYFFSTETFGVYHVGAIEVPVALLLASATTVLIPEVSRLYGEGRGDAIAALWKGAVGRLALITVPLFFFLFAFAGVIIGVYLPVSFARSELVFRIFLLALPLRCAVYNPLLVGMGKAKWALWGGLGDLGLNFALSVIFVQLLLGERGSDLAMLGPAAATVLSTYLQVGFLLLVIGHQLRRSPWELLPWARLLRVSAVSAAAGLIALAGASPVDPPSLKLAVGALIFAAALLGSSRLCPQEREEVRAMLRSALKGGWGVK